MGRVGKLLEWRSESTVGMATCKCCLIFESSWNGALAKYYDLAFSGSLMYFVP